MKKYLTMLFVGVISSASFAGGWQSVYDVVGEALKGQQQQMVEMSARNEELTARSLIQYGVNAPDSVRNASPKDANILLREYLFHASDVKLISLIDEKGLDNALTQHFKAAVAESDARNVMFVRNQIVEMLASLYPYGENQ